MIWVSEKNVFQTIFVMLEEPDSSKIGYWFSLYMQVRVCAAGLQMSLGKEAARDRSTAFLDHDLVLATAVSDSDLVNRLCRGIVGGCPFQPGHPACAPCEYDPVPHRLHRKRRPRVVVIIAPNKAVTTCVQLCELCHISFDF